MLPTRSINDLQDRHRSSLIQAIEDAKASEAKRNKLISQAHSRDRLIQLKDRYEAERERDQLRIKYLMADFEKISSGPAVEDMSAVLSQRQVTTLRPIDTMNTNRFVNSNLHQNDKEHQLKSEAIAKHARLKNAPKYNEYTEIKKLNLLTQKRDVLHNLITLQKQALYGQDVSDVPTQQRGPGRAMSVCSYRTDTTRSSTGNSWASFTSKRSEKPFRPPKFIPKLNLG